MALTGNLHIKGLIIVVSAVAWVGAFLLHGYSLPIFSHMPGIDLLFLPSGVRILVIMIGGIWAVAGVCLGSLFLAGPEFNTGHPWGILAIAAGSGLYPYAALRISLLMAGIDKDLENLSAVKLPLISLGVAVGSSVLHNVAFSLLGVSPWSDFGKNVAAMATGDFVGILIAVLIVCVLLRFYRKATA